MTWYALQHKPSQGDRALTHLQNQDIACFYPKITVEKIKASKRTNKPAAIPDDVIQHIKDSLHSVAEQGGIKPGQAVDLEDGPFKGISAIFQAYDGEERAIVLISFMQKQQTVKVPLSTLHPRRAD